MIAHIRKIDEKRQPLGTHCRNVMILAKSAAEKAGLQELAALGGLLHDMGKATAAFCGYLEWSVRHPGDFSRRGSVYHAPIGAIYVYERWYPGKGPVEQITAQIISLAVLGHHGGLSDCVGPDERSAYLDSIRQDKNRLMYDEATTNFLSQVAPETELDRLFEAACREVGTLLRRVEKEDRIFAQGMLARLLLSFIVDADRWDTACFENDEDPFQEDTKPDWPDLSARLEEELSKPKYSRSSGIGKIRREVSDQCAKAAEKTPGIYTLTVPTGGGKTLSSLRFALGHAQRWDMARIFYIIPFNTILDQNSKDIREALGQYEGILEHYGTFLSELEGDDGEREEKEHLLLTERWNMPIIMTSVVQFLDSLFRAENSCTRRMNRLAGSILIFDEVQALPKPCTVLFEMAIHFLAACLNCTVLLCTATQPRLEVQAQPLLPEALKTEMFSVLKRTRLIDESDVTRDNERAAQDIAALQEQCGSVLVIVNTKRVASDLFARLMKMDLPAECIHLSTSMCPAHRLRQIEYMEERLGKQPVICISTMLIEAGINISFPCVVRSLAGLPNILQAAGRCNRHMEQPEPGRVFIWRLAEERLGSLEEIREGQSCTGSVKEYVKAAGPGIGLDSLEAMDWFFRKERISYGEQMLGYPWKERKKLDITLRDMLVMNRVFRQHSGFEARGAHCGEMRLFQAFDTAGHAFRVIDQDTVSILVPFGGGTEIVADLCSEQSLQERIRTLRRAQKYTVSVWRDAFKRLCAEGALYPVGETGEYALRKEYYDENLGLLVRPEEMDFMNY